MFARLERDLRATGDSEDFKYADRIKQIFQERGKDIFVGEDEALHLEWQRQVERYIELEFNKELNMSEEVYRNSLPKFTAQPENYKKRFDIPVIVDARI